MSKLNQTPKLVTSLTAALVALLIAAPAAHAENLTVRITGIESSEGIISVGILDGVEGFPGDREVLVGQRVDAASPEIEVIFCDLPPGRYAIAVQHDEDGDGKQDKNLFGAPTEPYGFSNDARGRFGPPDFEDAAFDLGEDALTITIELAG